MPTLLLVLFTMNIAKREGFGAGAGVTETFFSEPEVELGSSGAFLNSASLLETDP